MRKFDQVAAVCYRIRGGVIEFLLVQTRGSGRWTFPKGCAEAGLTHAQAAAMEAFEEAGVHGRIEEASFAKYKTRGNGKHRFLSVSAHLCEVLRLGAPKESNRNRTWFQVGETKMRLAVGRSREEAGEFVRVMKKAIERIARLKTESAVAQNRAPLHAVGADGLYRVQFEARIENAMKSFSAPHERRLPHARKTVSLVDADLQRRGALCDILPFTTLQQHHRGPKLLPGRKS